MVHLEYQGTRRTVRLDYQGWQIQQGNCTVQHMLLKSQVKLCTVEF